MSRRGVLVTGGSGLIGSYACRLLARNGYSPVTLGRKKINQLMMEDMQIDFNFESIVHFAAAVPGLGKCRDDFEAGSTTRAIDDWIVKLARRSGKHLVYASGTSVHIDDKGEGHVSPYLAAKAEGERKVQELDSYSILRISAPMAPELPIDSVAGNFLQSALENGLLEVWGKGSREQNYVDVRDVACYFEEAATHKYKGVYNLVGETVSMSSLASKITKIAGEGSIVFSGKLDPKESQRFFLPPSDGQANFEHKRRYTLDDSISYSVNRRRQSDF